MMLRANFNKIETVLISYRFAFAQNKEAKKSTPVQDGSAL